MQNKSFILKSIASAIVLGCFFLVWRWLEVVGPTVQYSTTAVYFVRGKTEVEKEVRISNIGDRPLEIKAVQQSCSCVKAALSCMSVASHKESIMTIKMTGESDGSIFVLTDDPNNVEQRIQVLVVPDKMIESRPPVIDFGIMKSNQTSERSCSVLLRVNPEQWPGNPKSLLDVFSNHDSCRLETKWIERHELKLTAYLSPSSVGKHESQVTVTCNGKPLDLVVPVIATFSDPSP